VRDRVVRERGGRNLLPLPPPAVRRQAAVAWRDRDLVVGGRQVANWLLPPQALAGRPAAAVWAHFLLPTPALWWPAAAAWRDGDRMVGELGRKHLLPPPPPADEHPAAAAR